MTAGRRSDLQAACTENCSGLEGASVHSSRCIDRKEGSLGPQESNDDKTAQALSSFLVRSSYLLLFVPLSTLQRERGSEGHLAGREAWG